MSDIRRAAFFIAPALHRPTLPTGFFALAISDCPAIDRDISNLRGYPCILRIASLCNLARVNHINALYAAKEELEFKARRIAMLSTQPITILRGVQASCETRSNRVLER